jgi:outer membrane protein
VKTHGILVLAGILTAALSAGADTLSLDAYVKMVLKNNPQSTVAASAVEANSAQQASALSRLLPQFSASGGLSRSGGGSVTSSSLGSGPSSGAANSTTAAIGAQMTVVDLGKTYQYQAAGKSLDAARNDFQRTLQSMIVNARSAYFNYLLSEQLLAVNDDALKQAKLHYDEAKALYDVGKQAKIAVTKANVDVANAEVNIIHARNALKLARVQLETVAAAPLHDPLTLTDSLSATEDSLSLDDALARSRQQRPDLISLKANLEAARLQLKAARAAYLPSLSASGGYNWRGSDPSTVANPDWESPGWNFGLGLSVPLYLGGSVQAGVRQQQALAQKSEATLAAMVLSVNQEVQQDYLSESEARQRISATAALIEQAAEGLQMSQERYRAGIATSIEITDAEVTLANARSSHLQAQFDYRTAHVKLLSAIGDLHE